MQDDLIDIVIVGAHLSGMPLNHELTSLESRFLREDITAPVYRLYELPETSPSKPGLLRVATGGTPVAVEVWALAPAAFGRFVARIPSPLSIGKIQLADGKSAAGFLVEAVAVEAARDISAFGGWRQFQKGCKLGEAGRD